MNGLKIKMDKNEFLMFVLFLKEYQLGLWKSRPDCGPMAKSISSFDYDAWADVCVSFMKKELRLADWAETEDGNFSFSQIWEMFRHLFKDSTEKETISFATLIFERWGDLQLRGQK
jgi:hypothetical protein